MNKLEKSLLDQTIQLEIIDYRGFIPENELSKALKDKKNYIEATNRVIAYLEKTIKEK